MKRRKFLKSAGIAVAGAIAAPYILPSGRLFAGSGVPIADHVVYVLFAGGVRQQEAVLQQYLAGSQDINIEGNILYNLLDGQAPGAKIVYGTTPQGQPNGSQPIPRILSQTLEGQGTLFPEVNFSKGGTGHYFGLSTIVTGQYSFGQGLRQRPLYPTIFEYARKHLDLPATKVWFVGNGIGNSTPLLNYSDHPDYGPTYGANFLAPGITFSDYGTEHLANAKVYHPEEEIGPIYEMKNFLDQVYQAKAGTIPGIYNTEEERQDIKKFIEQTFQKKAAGTVSFPPVSDSGDLRTIGYTCELLKYFKPTLTVVNMNSIDGCHTSFSGYLSAMHRCDHAVGHLWNFIQTQVPEMAGKTTLILVPEHGRSLAHNSILDENAWYAFDHNSDPNARRVFSMMVGAGVPAGLRVGSESNPTGDSTDCVPTIAELLGIKNEVMNAGYLDAGARSLFDRI